MSKAKSKRDPILAIDAAEWRQRIRQLSTSHSNYWPREYLEAIDWSADQFTDALLDRPSEYGLASVKQTRAGYSMTGKDFGDAMAIAFRAGFLEAVRMHRRELLSVGDLIERRQSHDAAGDKGRDALTRKKEDRFARIRAKWAEMKAAGEEPTNESVARACGVSRSTVIRAFKPPPRTKR
jgi:hypothetical protein